MGMGDLGLSREVGTWIRELRINNRLVISDVAEGTGFEFGLIEGWERGEGILLTELLDLLRFYKVCPDLAAIVLGLKFKRSLGGLT